MANGEETFFYSLLATRYSLFAHCLALANCRRRPVAPPPVIRLHPDDGVLIARSSLPPGMVVADGVTTVERIPAGHKVAIRPIAVGEPVRRYGQIIGFATIPIAPGQHVHSQNWGSGG